MKYTRCKAADLPEGLSLLVLEPRETYDKAIVGYTDTPKDHWPRKGGTTVAVYSRRRCITALRKDGMTEDDAVEWFEYNTSGAWMGEGTPVFV
jgi:hypothetical protein